jgi:uncharacterized protein
MQMTLDADSRVNLIRSYAAGEVRIGERVVHESLLVTASTLIEKWDPRDLEAVFALKPDVVLLGSGEVQQFPPSSVRAAFAQRRIALEPMTLGAACRTFNILVQEGRNVAAALVLNEGS